uniref:Uncharacterized protein n=1 Tax=Graphocephala atropunctata TaxID=36148 RepID=A0A1B6KZ57_9HEMI
MMSMFASPVIIDYYYYYYIQIIDKSQRKKGSLVPVDLERHFSTKEHEENIVPMSTLKNCLLETFSGEIPQIVLNHILTLTMDDFYYICAICEKMIGEGNCSSMSEKNFSYHLLSMAHTKNMKEFNSILSQLRHVYGGIPPVVLNNQNFLKSCERNNKYLCSLCDETLLVNPTDLKKTVENFENHLYSIEHIKNVKVDKVLSLIPEMENSLHFPSYLIRSVDYFGKNGKNCFCVLCSENIKLNPDDPYDIEQSFKAHILSEFHQQNLKYRRDPSNEVFVKLQQVFESLPDSVVENLNYLTLYENNLSCSVCEEFIIEEQNTKKTLKNITSHVSSDWHKNNVIEEIRKQELTVDGLNSLFGSLPKSIEDNIDHVEFSERTNNFKCLLCEVVVHSYDINNKPQTIPQNVDNQFDRHFKCNKHLEQEKNLNYLSEALRTDLEEIFGSIPQFVVINWDFIDYDELGNHFFCILCSKKILVDNGNKMDKLTLQNFRTHFHSGEHLSALKQKANEKLEVVEKLDGIFGRVPSYLLSNIDHIRLIEENGEFHCKTCDKTMYVPNVTKNCFYEHLSGSRHKLNVRKKEVSHDAALDRLDASFSRVPEFLLRNIYHLCMYNKTLFCLVCQKLLPIDGQDLGTVKRFLRCHMDSEQHEGNVKLI